MGISKPETHTSSAMIQGPSMPSLLAYEILPTLSAPQIHKRSGEAPQARVTQPQ